MGFSKITKGFSSLISQIEAQLSLNKISPDRRGPRGNRSTENEKKRCQVYKWAYKKKKNLLSIEDFQEVMICYTGSSNG